MPTYISRKIVRRYSADGAIDINATEVILASSGGAALTLPDPPASPHWNGHTMRIVAKDAQTYTVTNTTGFNAGSTSSDVLTLNAIGDSAIIQAIDGVWHILALEGSAVA